jgi:predicted peroxiredoxin
MSNKLVIVMANTDPRNGEELGAPIFQATVAAAMEYEVEVICTATSGRLMKKGVAEKLHVDLIPECAGIVGGAYLVEEIMESDCKVLTY